MTLVMHLLLAHAIWAIPITLALCLWLVPGSLGALLVFARSTFGRVVLACVVAGAIGWEARAALDAAWDRTQALKAAAATAEARAAAAELLANERARQALAQHAIATAAADRARDAGDRADHLQSEVDTYAQQLTAQPVSSGSCRLSAGDARRLRHLGAGPRGKPAPGAAGRSR